MNKSGLRSFVAVFAGFVLVLVLTIPTDMILEQTGIMKQPFDHNSDLFILFVVLYRCLYGISGSYLTARLAPANPMRHVMIGGMIGLALSILGTVAMWDKPPHWYPILLDLTALPCAWLGGTIYLRRGTSQP